MMETANKPDARVSRMQKSKEAAILRTRQNQQKYRQIVIDSIKAEILERHVSF